MVTKKDFLDAMKFRHACKFFDDKKKVKKADQNYILELGRLSPSSMGLEQWTFLVIEDKNLISTWSKYQIELLRWSKSLGFDIDWEYRYNPPPTKLTLRFNVLQYFKR